MRVNSYFIKNLFEDFIDIAKENGILGIRIPYKTKNYKLRILEIDNIYIWNENAMLEWKNKVYTLEIKNIRFLNNKQIKIIIRKCKYFLSCYKHNRFNSVKNRLKRARI